MCLFYQQNKDGEMERIGRSLDDNEVLSDVASILGEQEVSLTQGCPPRQSRRLSFHSMLLGEYGKKTGPVRFHGRPILSTGSERGWDRGQLVCES